ncbi:hypothetical protein ANCDUO_19958 [Ancylostoma duodenale]|uniref:Uncharacterized protein n=1 Tax=Ancylostoma duodenale TaxID=51022 RepID=A0A0C2FN24_9BILA|nr:hypothetical protein ANCDUO_19958 [Ancylostoma duodenale]
MKLMRTTKLLWRDKKNAGNGLQRQANNNINFSDDYGFVDQEVIFYRRPIELYLRFITEDLVKLVLLETNPYEQAKYATWNSCVSMNPIV